MGSLILNAEQGRWLATDTGSSKVQNAVQRNFQLLFMNDGKGILPLHPATHTSLRAE